MQTPTTDELEGAATEAVNVEDVFNSISMKRWGIIRRKLAVNSQDIVEDNFLLMLVAAHEWNFQQTGKHDQWDRFLAMSLHQITEFLALDKGNEDGSES